MTKWIAQTLTMITFNINKQNISNITHIQTRILRIIVHDHTDIYNKSNKTSL